MSNFYLPSQLWSRSACSRSEPAKSGVGGNMAYPCGPWLGHGGRQARIDLQLNHAGHNESERTQEHARSHSLSGEGTAKITQPHTKKVDFASGIFFRVVDTPLSSMSSSTCACLHSSSYCFAHRFPPACTHIMLFCALISTLHLAPFGFRLMYSL